MSNYIRNTIGALAITSSLSANAPKIPTSQTEIRQKNVIQELANEGITMEGSNDPRKWEPWEYRREASIQRSIDSLAFKQILDKSNLAADSSTVNEFNRISSNTAPHPRHSLHTFIQGDYNQIMKDLGCSEKEINKIRSECMNVYPKRACGEMHFTKEGNIHAVTRHQYLTDSVAYTKFFKKKGILNPTAKKELECIAKKIKP